MNSCEERRVYEFKGIFDLLGSAKMALIVCLYFIYFGTKLKLESMNCSELITTSQTQTSVSFTWSAPPDGMAIIAGVVTALAALSAVVFARKAKSFEEPTTAADARLRRGKVIIYVVASLALAQSGYRLYSARPYSYRLEKTFERGESASFERFRAARTCEERYTILAR